jgi:hypothetical protein
MLNYSYQSLQNESSWHSNQDSGQKENKIKVGQATNRRYQSCQQKKERKTYPKVEEEVAQLLKQQQVEEKVSRYQCNVRKYWLFNIEGWVSSNSNKRKPMRNQKNNRNI